MAFMHTKTCCCGCSLKTGTVILALFLLVPSAIILLDAVSNSRNYTSLSITILISLVGTGVSAIYAVKMDKRLFLLPFMVIVIGLFILVAVFSCGVMLVIFGTNAVVDKFVNNFLSMEVNANLKSDSVSVRYGSSKGSQFSDLIGPFSILVFVVCLIIIIVFLHFVKVVCSLFAEMENPAVYGNGIVFSSPYAPQVISSPSMSLY